MDERELRPEPQQRRTGTGRVGSFALCEADLALDFPHEREQRLPGSPKMNGQRNAELEGELDLMVTLNL